MEWPEFFAYFMERKVQMTDDAIFDDTSHVIKNAIKKIYDQHHQRTEISKNAFEIALSELI